MENYTKQNPGCYHSAVRYASELTGIPAEKELEFNIIDDLYDKRNVGKRRLLYKSYNIYGVDSNGNRFPFWENHKRFDQNGLTAEKFIAKTSRRLSEFNVPIQSEGSYKDSLGGGWYSMVELFSINGKFFAHMECSCSPSF